MTHPPQNYYTRIKCVQNLLMEIQHYIYAATGKIVDATQEMLALGLCNIFGSFFSSMPTCGAFTRSAVSQASGVRTPLSGFYTGMIILLALSLLTPFFSYIPRATLASILCCAVAFMVSTYHELLSI